MKNKILYILGMALIFSACENEPEMEVSNTYPVSGEWYVHEYYGTDAYGPYHLQISNTAFSQDSVWIRNIYGDGVVIKSLVTADKTFDVSDATDYSGGYGKATISNTNIIDGDSIYFDVILYDADGEVEAEFYTAGHRWTGLE